MKRILAIILAVVMCSALLFVACGDESDKLDETIVATIGGVKISQAEYNYIYKGTYDQMASQYSQMYGESWYNVEIDDKGTTVGKKIKDDTIAGLKEMIAYEKLAAEKGIKVSDSEVDEYIRGAKQQLGGEQAYKKFIESYRTTDAAMKKNMKRVMLFNKYYEKISAEQDVEELNEEELKAEFLGSYMKVQHVLIQATFPEGEEDADDPVALEKANEVIAKLNEGADFDSLIEEYNEDPGMTKGNYYTFTTGEMVAEFEEASMNLQAGEYTTVPVKTSYGYHIIKKYELAAEGEDYENFKQQKQQQVIQEKVASVMNDIVEKKVDSLKVEKKDDVIDKYLNEWLKELGVNVNAPKTPYVAPEVPELPAEAVPTEETPAEEVTAETDENADADADANVDAE